VPLIPRPVWDPLPDPPGADPASATQFQALAAEELEGIEPACDRAGAGLADTAAALTDAERAADQLGLDLAEGAVELEGMTAEAAADNLVPELEAAAEQDAALGVVSDDVAAALGEPVETPTPPAPLPTPDGVPTGGEAPTAPEAPAPEAPSGGVAGGEQPTPGTGTARPIP
jgi:hypothetical protein